MLSKCLHYSHSVGYWEYSYSYLQHHSSKSLYFWLLVVVQHISYLHNLFGQNNTVNSPLLFVWPSSNKNNHDRPSSLGHCLGQQITSWGLTQILQHCNGISHLTLGKDALGRMGCQGESCLWSCLEEFWYLATTCLWQNVALWGVMKFARVTVGRFFIELDPWLQIETVQGQEKAASKRHCKRWSASNEPERGLVATRIVPAFRHIQRSLRHAGCGKTSSASDPPLVIHKPLSWWVMMRCLVFACHVQGRAAVPMVNFHYCGMAWNRIKQRTHVWP